MTDTPDIVETHRDPAAAAKVRRLARLLFLASFKTDAAEQGSDIRTLRREAWQTEKKTYLTQARRAIRLIDGSDDFELTFTGKVAAAEAED